MLVHSSPAAPVAGRLVRRRPSVADLAGRVPLTLTARDRQILAAVYTHGFLTTDLVTLAFFPPMLSTRQSPSSCAYERLRQLWLWECLERIELPVAPSLGGRRPFLYALGHAGVPIVAEWLGSPSGSIQRRRLDRLNALFIAHDLQLAMLWANLRAMLTAGQLASLAWTAERDLRARRTRIRDPQTNRWLPVLPDAYLEVGTVTGELQPYLAEIDQGTLTLERFQRKVRAFELYLKEGLFERHYGQKTFRVLVLTHASERLSHLHRVAESELVRPRRSDYLFGLCEVGEPTRFASAEWLTLAGDRIRPFQPLDFARLAPEPSVKEEKEVRDVAHH